MHRASIAPRLSRWAAAAWARVLGHSTDVGELAGMGLVVYGVAMYSVRNAVILGGLLLIGVSYLVGVRR